MEFKPEDIREDVQKGISWPADNPYGLKEMDMAIKVSHNRTPQSCDKDLETMFKVCLFFVVLCFRI